MKNKNDFRAKQSAINNYMQKYRVGMLVQDRVKLWLQYTWHQQKSLDESKFLSFLPKKMQTDLALRVRNFYFSFYFYIYFLPLFIPIVLSIPQTPFQRHWSMNHMDCNLTYTNISDLTPCCRCTTPHCPR